MDVKYYHMPWFKGAGYVTYASVSNKSRTNRSWSTGAGGCVNVNAIGDTCSVWFTITTTRSNNNGGLADTHAHDVRRS